MNNKYTNILNKAINNKNKIKKRILLVDGHNTFMRAMSLRNIVNDNGVHIGGLSGFLLSLGNAIKKLKPITDIIIVFDGKDTIKSRKKIYENYKTNKLKKTKSNFGFYSLNEEHNAIKFQMQRLFEYLKLLPVYMIKANYVEADDVIGYISMNHSKFFNDVNQIYIMSNDKDFKQCITKRDDLEISIFEPSKKIIIDFDKFKQNFQMIPENYTLLKCFIRDDSDNIPGVKGIAEKIFKKLFPFVFNTDIVFDVDRFYDIIKTDERYYKSKSKKIQTTIKSEDLVRTFYKLVDLRNNTINNINDGIIFNIKDVLSKRKPLPNKHMVFKLAVQDGVSNFIKNPIKWVEDVFIF